MTNKKIIIEEYSPTWALMFQQLKSVYLTHLTHLISDVQHVGSTSVAGLAAKPIIDIDLIISNKEDLGAVIENLRLLGYDHMGDQGISDREVFKPRSDQAPIDPHTRTWPKHHLYVCPADSISLKNHLAFRDFLRNNPKKAKAYEVLKRSLASENPYDVDLYVARKTPFITEVLKELGFDEQAVSRIVQNNSIDNLTSNR